MIKITTWVYEDGDVHITVTKQNRKSNALRRRASLNAQERMALVSLIFEELEIEFGESIRTAPKSNLDPVKVEQLYLTGERTENGRFQTDLHGTQYDYERRGG